MFRKIPTINIMHVGTLSPYMARLSESMELIIKICHVSNLHKDKYQPLVPVSSWTMMSSLTFRQSQPIQG